MHFKPTDFRKGLAGRRSLKPDAVPSNFHWSAPSPKRKSPRKRSQPPSSSAEMPSFSSVSEADSDTSAPDEIDNLLARIAKLEQQVNSRELENKQLLKNVDEVLESQFGLARFKDSDSDINFYRGFPNFQTLLACYNFLNPGENGSNIVYVNSAKEDLEFSSSCNADGFLGNKPGPRRKLSTLDDFFLVLVRLRLGLFELDLAHRFRIHVSTVNRICISWINFLYIKFGFLNIWPNREAIDKAMPQSFRDKYPKTRIIIDGTEIKCQTPSSLVLHSETYSSYKSHTTFKSLIGIAPSGHITFISQLYAGSISDRELTVRSGLLNLPFNQGDVVMADKGFTISDLLEPIGVGLNIPPFLGSQSQQTPSEVIATQEIASERIHVERAINKVKNFHIFNQVIPLSFAGSLNQMWTVCAMLTNMQNPIIT